MSDTSIDTGRLAEESLKDPALLAPTEPSDGGFGSIVQTVRQQEQQAAVPVTGGRIQQLRNGGFDENQIKAWSAEKTQSLTAAGFSESEINSYLTGNVTPPKDLPKPFLKRFIDGSTGLRVLDSIGKGAQTGFGEGPLGIDPAGQTDKFLTDIGLFNKPGEANPLRMFNEAIIRPAAALGDAVQRALNSGVTAAAFGVAQIGTELTSPDPESKESKDSAQRAGEELTEFGNIAALLSMSYPAFSRLKQNPISGKLTDEHFSGAPTGQDFGNTARNVGGPTAPIEVQQKLLKLYEDKGIHPAEVLSDATSDITISQKLLSTTDELPYSKDTLAQEMEAELSGGGGRKPPIEGEIIPPTAAEPPKGIESKPTIETSAEGSLESARESIRSKLSVGAESTKSPWSISKIYENLVDSLFGLQQTEKRISGGVLDEVSNSPTKLSRLFSGVADKSQDMLENGPRSFNTLERTGRGVRDILNDVLQAPDDTGVLSRLTDRLSGARTERLNNFRDFIVSARAVELDSRGINSGFDVEAAKKIVDAASPKEKAAFMELNHFQDQVLQYLKDSGVISDKGYAAMKEGNQLYVPFYRLFENVDEARSLGKSYIPYNPVKAIKGSARDVVDPLESVIRNTFAFVNLADRNVISTKLIDKLLAVDEALPQGFKLQKGEIPEINGLEGATNNLIGHNGGPEIAEALSKELSDALNSGAAGMVSIFRKGMKESYHIDPDLAKALKGLNGDSIGFITQVLNIPASLLRAGAVLTPEFATKFLIRDFFTAMATYDGVFTPLDTAKGLLSMVMKDKDFSDWLASGGGGGFSSFDRRYLQENLDRLTEQTGLTTRAWNVMLDPESSIARKLRIGAAYASGASAANKYILNPLRGLTEIALSANRLGAFKKSLRDLEQQGEVSKEGLLGAAWTSRETSVDPARVGANMRAFNMISAFANATIADPIRMVRAMKDNPVQSSIVGLGAITLPSVLLWWVNHNDSRYKEIPDWRRDMFWNILIDNWQEATPDKLVGRNDDQIRFDNGKYYVNNGPILSIPKPWGWGLVFGSMPERLLDTYYAHNSHGFENFANSIWSSGVPSMIPTATVPMWEQWANKSTFNGQTIIPAYLEKQLPEYQYTPYTTELAKRLGSVVAAFPGMRDASIGGSPIAGLARALTTPALMENYIQAWTGSLGNYALQLADYGLRKSGKIPDPVKPSWTIADVPFVRAFVVRYPSASAESIQDFYTDFDRVDKYYQTWRARLQAGDAEGAEKIRQAGGDGMFLRLTNVRTALGNQSTLIRWINDTPSYTSDEKRQLIDSIYFGMIQIAQTSNAMMEQIK